MCWGWEEKGKVEGPLTREKWDELKADPVVKNRCNQLAAIARNTVVTSEEKEAAKTEVKNKLPWITPHASAFAGNRRANDGAVYNGLVMFDVDHVDNPRGLWEKFVGMQGLDKFHVALAHITPGTRGLRIIFENQGGSIEENQRQMAQWLGVEHDPSVKDLARISYAVMGDWVHFENEELMFRDAPTPSEERETTPVEAEKKETLLPVPTTDIQEVEAEEVQTHFEGVSLREIYKAYIVKTRGYLPHTPGTRHNDLLTADCQMATLCENDYAALRAAAPGDEMNLPSQEVDEVIRSVVKMVKENPPRQAKKLQDCVLELKRKHLPNSSDSCDTRDFTPDYCQQPKLPPVIAEYASQWQDPNKRVAVTMACLPLLGTAFGTVTSKYIDRSKQYPIFQVVVEGNSSDGKSCVKRPEEDILRYVAAHDAEGEELEREYERNLKLFKAEKLENLPEDPCPPQQILSTATSASQLMKRASNSGGLICLQYTNEISTLTKNNRKGAWAQLTELWRLGFEGDFADQDYVNRDTFNGRTHVKLAVLACGTPLAVNELFTNPEDGCVQRFIFTSLGNQAYKSLEVPKELTARQKQTIDTILQRARDLSYDVDGNPREEYAINLPWLNAAIGEWLEEKRVEAAVSADFPLARDTYRRRAGVNGFRAGMLAYMLWDESPRRKQDVIAFARWVAEATLTRTLFKFGEKYQKIRDNQQIERPQVGGKQGKIVTLLPEKFTREEFLEAATKLGTTSYDAQRQLLTRLRQRGFIGEDPDNPIGFIKCA